MKKAIDIINEIRDLDETYTPEDIRNALEEGEFLSNFNWTQKEVEEAYDLIYNIKSWGELDAANRHGGARDGAGRPTNGCKTVGIRITPEEHDKLKQLGGSQFVREALEAADDSPLYVFYKRSHGDWDLEITTVYHFCKRHDIESYEAWKGSGETFDDVMDFEDKRDAVEFINMEIDDMEKKSELIYEVNAY